MLEIMGGWYSALSNNSSDDKDDKDEAAPNTPVLVPVPVLVVLDSTQSKHNNI